MTEAVKARIAARGWCTRASNNLSKLLHQEIVSKTELSDCIDEFDKRLNKLDDIQSQLEVELDVSELEADIEKAADYREGVRQHRIEAGKRLGLLLKQEAEKEPSEAADSSESSKVEAKLPKLELPKFSGESAEWQAFWDQFQAVVHDSDLPDVTKFTYLRSLLQGEAKAAIQGLSLTADHYRIACEILTERFGRKERIIFSHIQDLLTLSAPKQSNVSSLWKLQDDLLAHIRSLEALGISGGQYGVILTPLILSRLPSHIRMEWAREGENHESDLDWLLQFLQKEIQRRERSQTFKDSGVETKSFNVERRVKVATATALQTSSEVMCGFCGKRHSTDKCWSVSKLTLDDRKDKIRASGLCFRCLVRGHLAKGCVARCTKCNGRHHLMICTGERRDQKCPEDQATPDTNISHVGVTHNDFAKGNKPQIVLQTAQVSVQGKKGRPAVTATVLFDTGADRSYICSDLVDKVEPEWVSAQSVAYAAFGVTKASKGSVRNVYHVDLKCVNGTYEHVLLTETPVICPATFSPAVPQGILHSFGLTHFAADYGRGSELKVDILIGLDLYWKLVKPGVVSIPQGLVAQETVFGWILSGALTGGTKTENAGQVSHQLVCLNDISERMVSKFWDLDSIGITGKGEERDPVLAEFEQSISFSDSRYEVSLPWKKSEQGHEPLNNEKLARKRLDSLDKRLDRAPDLRERYDRAISELEQIGVVQEVPEQEMVSPYPTYYMPHHPVVNESKLTTKVRPVFDASAPSYNGVSLNDCLETGPCLLPNLCEILIRFRRWKVALTADITKAFLQIKVRQEDQDVHRFLWKVNGKVKVMRFTRVPFGNKSSPFLLNATIKHHLSHFPKTNVVQELEENLYVDDWLSGSDSDEVSCSMMSEAVDILKQCSMPLTKWCSNSSLVTDMVYQLCCKATDIIN